MDIPISVVTPSLNHGHFIEETIRSVLAQDYPCVEHIVVDGGSIDRTPEILARYPHLKVVTKLEGKQTAAMNEGIRIGSGRVFGVLNADDVYREGALGRVARIFEEDPTTAAVAGNCDVIDEQSRRVGHHRARLDRYEDLLRYWQWGERFCISHPAVFLRRDLLDEIGWFDESFDLAMDYELWLRLGARYPLTILPETLAAFRVSRETKTQRQRQQMNRELFRASRRFWNQARWIDRLVIPCQAMLRGLAPVEGQGIQGTP